MSRSVVMERLGRLRTREQAPPLPSSLPDFPRYSDAVAQFKTELERVSGVFLDGRSPDLLAQALEQVLHDSQADEVVWDSKELFEKHGIPHHRPDSQAFRNRYLLSSDHPLGKVRFPLVLRSGPYSREVLAGMTVSASTAVCGVAETGTVVESTGPGVGRWLSVLAPVHVAFLRQQDIMMNQAEFFSQFKLGEGQSYRVLVTGPSRTADIEKTLVLGVHGPQRHYVILTE